MRSVILLFNLSFKWPRKAKAKGKLNFGHTNRKNGILVYGSKWFSRASGSSLLPPGKGQHPLESQSYSHIQRRKNRLCFQAQVFGGDGGRASLHCVPGCHIWGCHVPSSDPWILCSVTYGLCESRQGILQESVALLQNRMIPPDEG